MDQTFGDELVMNTESYVDLHGRMITVLEADDGELFVSLNDVKRAGFSIFRKDNFEPVITDRSKILNEFEMFLLSQGRNYLLQTRADINEDDILERIERVKNKLLNGNNNNTLTSREDKYCQDRMVNQTSSKNLIVTIPQNNSQGNSKTLPLNFCPNQRNHSVQTCNKTKNHNRIQKHEGQDFRESSSNSIIGFQNNTPQRKFSATGKQKQSPPKPNADEGVQDSGRQENNNKLVMGALNKQLETDNVEHPTNFETKQCQEANKGSDSGSVVSEMKKFTMEPIETVKLNVGSSEMVHVSRTLKRLNKDTLYFVQLVKNNDLIEQLLVDVNVIAEQQDVFQPVLGKLCLAKFEGVWYRARVAYFKNLEVWVNLIDYGNREKITAPLKVIPPKLKTVPAQALRMVMSKEARIQLAEESDVQVVAKKQFESGTFVVNVICKSTIKPHIQEKPICDIEESFFDVPVSCDDLKDGEKVAIMSVTQGRMILQNKECYTKSKNMYSYIEKFEKNSVKNPKVGQVVLCSKDGLRGFHRGVIKNIEGPIAKVSYVDYNQEEGSLLIKSIVNVDKQILNFSVLFIVSPPFKALENVSKEGQDILQNLIALKTKMSIVLDGEFFDLKLDSGVFLSESIVATPTVAQETPSTPKESTVSARQAADTIFIDDMSYVIPQQGLNSYVCCTFESLSNITLLPLTEEHVQHFHEIFNIQVKEDVMYVPSVNEMCLAWSTDRDGASTWNRAVVLSPTNNEKCQVLFVDFGSVEDIETKFIRKFPQHLKDIPILGVTCYFIGLPDNKPEILDRLKALITEGECLDINIETPADELLKYGIDIPSIYEQLKSEGLLQI